MKKITFTLSFLFIALFSYGQCNYQLQMIDSYGDGWGSNNSIDITVGQVTTNYTLSSGASSTVDLPVTIGDAITAVFNCGGSYCYEASYRILNSEGIIVANNPYSTNVTAQDGIIASCPSCSAPTALSAANIMADSAEISWTSDGTSFNIEVVDVTGGGAATGTATYSGVTSPYSLTGLSSANNYAVYVQTDCGGDQSSWLSVSFSTLCNPFTAPYTQNFDSDAGELQQCWNSIVSNSTSTYSNILSGITSSVSTTNTIRFYNSSDITGDYFLVSPNFSDLDDTKRLRFSVYQNQGTSDDGDVLEIGTMTDPADSATYTTFKTIPYADRVEDTWVDLTVNFDTYTGTDNYIAIKMNFGATYNYYYFDDFYYEDIPSCVEPADLTATAISTTGAVIDWVSDGSAFMIEIQPGGVAQGTPNSGTPTEPSVYVIGDQVAYTLTSVDLTGYLDANTSYSVYVVNVCQDGNSLYSGPLNFTTDCVAVFAAPYANGFEDLSCWTNDNSSAAWQIGNGVGSGNPGSVTEGVSAVYFNSFSYQSSTGPSTLMSPSIDLSALTVPNLTFDFVDTGSSAGTDVVEVVVDNGTGAVVVSTLEQPQTWTELIVDLSAYANETIKIGFRVTSDWGYSNPHIDNLKVDEAPSCSTPTNLTATAISTTGAVIDWVSDGSAFMIEIQPGGVAQGTPNSGTPTEPSVYVIGDQVAYTTTSVDLTGFLDANTSYSVYVVNVCQGGNSLYSGPLNFTTEPNPIVPNYINDFSTFPGDLWSQGQGSLNNGPGGTVSGWESGQFSNGTIGAASINIWSSSTDEWLISPTFDLSNGTFYLNVDASATQYGSQVADASLDSDDFVTLMASIDDGSTWAELYRWDAANNPGAAGKGISEISLENYTATSKFAFYAESSVYISDSDFFIKNFQITNDALGIEEIIISQFTYFPNPVNDQLTINAQANVDGIAVLNMLGQVVSRQSPNSLNCVVDMAALRTGVYFVQVSIGNKTETVRVLKQ